MTNHNDTPSLGERGEQETNWIKISDCLPGKGDIVETKIVDERGERNVADLRFNGALWFFPDGTMYVYSNPTHWRPKNKNERP